MLRPEPLDIVIVLFVAFLLFGGINRMPEAARAIGKGIREFRLALTDKDDKESTNSKNSGA